MTPQEFKAWFEGYAEAFDNEVPTNKQWKRIKAQVAGIDGTVTTYTVFRDRYGGHWYPPPAPWWVTYNIIPNGTTPNTVAVPSVFTQLGGAGGTMAGGAAGGITSSNIAMYNAQCFDTGGVSPPTISITEAFTQLGLMDAAADNTFHA